VTQTVVSDPEPIVPPKQRLGADEWWMRALFIGACLWLVVTLLLPLYMLFSKSVRNESDDFVGLGNFFEYFSTPALITSIEHSIFIACLSTIIVIGLAFPFAFALTRSCMPGKAIMRGIALIPLLAPSLLAAIAVRYLFGNQGFFNWMMGEHTIYGPIGIVIGMVFYTFPFALLLLNTALSMADSRLYEAALTLKASKLRIFFTVTLPGAKYGIASAALVVFTLVITDFGIPKVTGGSYNVLATDIYKQIIGQQNFEMGAVVGVVLLIPAVFAFTMDRVVQRKQMATLTVDAVAYEPKPNRWFDTTMLIFCLAVNFVILTILAIAVYGSVIRYWPYNLELTLAHYDFARTDPLAWTAYTNSIKLGLWTMVFGTLIVFSAAYMVEKARGFNVGRGIMHFLSMMPLAVPGLVLGVSYILFFNKPLNPFNFVYATMAILVISTIIHYSPVPYLVGATALKQMDREFEPISASLKVPFYRTFWRITVPVCLPAILDISIFFFLRAMTTVSAVIFLFSPDTIVSSVMIVNMDEVGLISAAAAMSIMIVVTSISVRLLHWLLTRAIARRAQAWRHR